VMIVAFLIRTGAFGWRLYVDGYCARSALKESCVAVEVGAAACAGVGAWAARAPAQAATPARRSTPAVRMPGSPIGLLGELNGQGLSHDIDSNQAPRPAGSDEVVEPGLPTTNLHAIRRELARRNRERIGRDNLCGPDALYRITGRDDAERKRLASCQGQGRNEGREGVVVVSIRRSSGIDHNGPGGAAGLRLRGVSLDAAAAIYQVDRRVLPVDLACLVHTPHVEIRRVHLDDGVLRSEWPEVECFFVH